MKKMFRLLWLFEEGNDISCWPKKLMKKPNRAKADALAQIRKLWHINEKLPGVVQQ